MRSIFRDATLSTVNSGDASVIDINMIEGFVPGVGGVPGVPGVAVADTAPVENLAGARTSLTTASERGTHGLENVEADRFLVSGRFHMPRRERDHMGVANPRSLLFDDLSIFSHRHVAPTSVAAAAETGETPMVARASADQRGHATGDADRSNDEHAEAEKNEGVKKKKKKTEDDEEHDDETKDAGTE